MKSNYFGRLLFCCLLIAEASCTANTNKERFNKWLGNYAYTESAPASSTTDRKVMSWELTVNKVEKGEGMYFSILNVGSTDGYFSSMNNVSGNDKELIVIYDKLLSKLDKGFHKGDTLFTLLKEADGIRTKWNKLQPALPKDNVGTCTCFIFNGINESGNIFPMP